MDGVSVPERYCTVNNGFVHCDFLSKFGRCYPELKSTLALFSYFYVFYNLGRIYLDKENKTSFRSGSKHLVSLSYLFVVLEVLSLLSYIIITIL